MTGPRALFLPCYVMLQVSAALLPPSNLRLSSENFKHILTWKDPNKASSVYYCVQYQERFQGFQNVTNCCNITSRQCDLTKDLTNFNSLYQVRVFTFTNQDTAKYASSVHLTPVQDTILGPPIVNVTPGLHSLHLFIRPPVSHLWSKEKQQYISMLSNDVYPRMECNVSLEPTREGKLDREIINEEHSSSIPHLMPHTNYCVSVSILRANPNTQTLSKPSPVMCVVTEGQEDNGSSTVYIIVSVIGGVLLLIGLVFFLIGLDKAGYICRAKTTIPKVLKSLPTSESMFSNGSEFTSPTFSIPVEIISQKIEVEQKLESKVKICEEGYANRKRLLDSDTSGTMTSGELSPDVSSSLGSSGEAKSSTEDDLSGGHLGNGVSTVVSELGGSSVDSLPVSALDDSSNLPFDHSGVFNINLNSISIADPAWASFTPPEVTQEVAQVSMESHEAGTILDQHSVDFCLGVGNLEEGEEYGSDYEEEQDISENDDSDSHLVSGYMRR
ncbi:interferon alpha/beta receptor 2-like isoform 1-T3 [Leptodactylus fuscus]|uniref:interferon alpha/beta receptor 2-like n=1 Tax=Leptodactylus fuscus TaxID=238119 RepID=UPI003F4F38C8